jgi:hypothetical protein
MANRVRQVLPSERPMPVRVLISEWSGCGTFVLHTELAIDRWWLFLIVYFKLGTCCSDIVVIGSHHYPDTYSVVLSSHHVWSFQS